MSTHQPHSIALRGTTITLLAGMLTALAACSGGGSATGTPADSTAKDIFTRGAEVLTWSQVQKEAYTHCNKLFCLLCDICIIK